MSEEWTEIVNGHPSNQYGCPAEGDVWYDMFEGAGRTPYIVRRGQIGRPQNPDDLPKWEVVKVEKMKPGQLGGYIDNPPYSWPGNWRARVTWRRMA